MSGMGREGDTGRIDHETHQLFSPQYLCEFSGLSTAVQMQQVDASGLSVLFNESARTADAAIHGEMCDMDL
jgi:hypothetical protein